MTRISKNFPDQTAAARPSHRSSRRRAERPKTRDTDLPASKTSFKPATDAPPDNSFAKTKGRSFVRRHTRQTPIHHSDVTQQYRR
jgi:hypothetical protein